MVCYKPVSQGRRQHRVLLIFTLELETQMLGTNFFFPIMKTIKSTLNTSNGKKVLSLLLREACSDLLTLHSTLFGVNSQRSKNCMIVLDYFEPDWCKRYLGLHCQKDGISSLANAVEKLKIVQSNGWAGVAGFGS